MHKKVQQSGEIKEDPDLHSQKIWTVGMLLSSSKIKNKDDIKNNFSGPSTINVKKKNQKSTVDAALCQR